MDLPDKYIIAGRNGSMTEFNAYYYDNKFYFGRKKEYTLGEILIKILSKNLRIWIIIWENAEIILRTCDIQKNAPKLKNTI